MDDQFYFYLALVPLLGILAQLVAWWIRVPSILLLLGFGVLLGLWMNPDEILTKMGGDANMGPKVLFPLVSLAVAVILFEGGLSLRFRELKSAGSAVVRLCTFGAAISWILTSLLAWWLLQMDYRMAILLGAVLVVTGPTVVAPLLRHIRPNRKIGSIVKWEGIIIDPIGAILAVLVFEQLFHLHGHSEAGFGWLAPFVSILKTAAVGGGLAIAASAALIVMVKKYWIPDYLHGVAFLSVAIAVFALSNGLMHESGLVTVTLMGIILTNQKYISIEHVIEFKENLGVFLISCLFIVLGSRLDLTALADVGWRGAIFVALMILIVRPASVMGSLAGSKMSKEEKWFLSFLAPRGIVAAAVISVFALEILALAEHDEALRLDAAKLVPATFMVIVGTVAVYGLGAAAFARKLGLADGNPQGILFAGADDWIRDIAKTLQEHGYAVAVVDTNYNNVSSARMLGVPAYCASILSEHIHEEVNLAGIGRMLALTQNDAVNAMAAREYAHMFGSKNVFRLSPADHSKGDRSKVGHKATGRALFSDDWSEERLQKRYAEGYRPKFTKLSAEFTYEDFKTQYGNDVLVLMVFDSNGIIQINTADFDLEPNNDQSVLAIIHPDRANNVT